MSRQEHKRRRVAKHTAAVAAVIFRLAALAAFVCGVIGSAGYIEKGGSIVRGVAVGAVSLMLALALRVLSGAMEGGHR